MRIAGVQSDINIGDVDGNLRRMSSSFRKARSEGAELVVFPECSVTGYSFNSLDDALKYTQDVPGPATDLMQGLCKKVGGFIAFGMLETAPNGGLFNAAVLIGAEGLVGLYRKIHLPYFGVDRFASFGDRPFVVHQTNGVQVGLNICYDSGFPESSRIMSLQGADLIVLPTNWPPAAIVLAENVIRTRALENGVYYIAVNRVGEENGTQFIGRSSICAPDGEIMSAAGPDEETIIYADIDPARSRQKLRVRNPKVHMINRMADRRPELYNTLVEPHDLKRPGR